MDGTGTPTNFQNNINLHNVPTAAMEFSSDFFIKLCVYFNPAFITKIEFLSFVFVEIQVKI